MTELEAIQEFEDYAYHRSLKQDSGWISVKDRLPESDDEFVLVLANGKPSKNITLEEACELATYSAEDG